MGGAHLAFHGVHQATEVRLALRALWRNREAALDSTFPALRARNLDRLDDMARPTLKLNKALPAPATPRAPTSRAIRAMRGVRRSTADPATSAGLPPDRAAKASAGTALSATACDKGSAAAATAPTPPAARRRPREGPANAPDSPRRRHRDRRKGGAPPAREGARVAKPGDRSPPSPAVAKVGSDDPRLSKRMSELGLCSRREADEWIRNGWVRVDGAVVDTLGTRVPMSAQITVERAASREQAERVTILLNKPIGYVSGQAEDGYRPASVLITQENRWTGDRAPLSFRPQHLRGLAPAGRLDIDSTGLLVFTQDGRIAKRLVGRDSEVEKEYLVRVEGKLSAEGLRRLGHGLELDGVKLKPAKVSWQNEDQLRFVLREGRKRQIRRMCELVGLEVVGLKRVRTGSVVLGSLPVGQWRYLRPDERF